METAQEPVLRTALVADVPAIADLINDYAEQGRMLHRAHADLYEHLREFQVLAAGSRVVGVVGLRIMWWNLAEVYALAVAPDYRGRGLGKRLVMAAVCDAEALGIGQVFALTYEREFFERCGFEVVDRLKALPIKVWSECIQCPKNQACDEIAMVRSLPGAQTLPAGAPAAAAPASSTVIGIRLPVLSEPARRIDREAGWDE